ncbi:MAG: flagellar hook-associated protein FlgL [Pseudomonadota bacterium]|nr:flagellar hook-associated protein FlgL [Pseudomonadota bacterium]
MKLSTLALQRMATQGILEQQVKLARIQLQVATGQRILSPSDDPAGATRLLSIDAGLDQIAQYDKNATLALNRLSSEESALNSVGNVLQRARELVVQALNGTQTSEDRELISAEIGQILDELVRVANSRDANGEYLFSGNISRTKPFQRGPGGTFNYFGDQGQRFLSIGDNRQVAVGDSGAEVFQLIRNGNGTFTTVAQPTNTGTGVINAGSLVDPTAWVPDTYTVTFTSTNSYEVTDSSAAVVSTGTFTSEEAITFNGIEFNITGTPSTGDQYVVEPARNQDMFTTLQNIFNALANGASSPDQRARQNSELGRGLSEIDQAIEKILDTRTVVGGRLKTIETQQGINQGTTLELSKVRSSIQDLDFAEAVSQLNIELVGLEAAQKAYTRVQNLSLFNFI